MTQPSQPGQLSEADNLDPKEPEDLQKTWYEKYKDLPYKDLALRMMELKKLATEAETAFKAAAAEFDVIRLRVVPQRLNADGMSSIRLDGIGRLGLTSDAYCTVIPGLKPDLIAWLKSDAENALLVKEDINPSTLKSLVKGMAERHNEQQGEADLEAAASDELPEDAEPTEFEQALKYVNYTPFQRASITKG